MALQGLIVGKIPALKAQYPGPMGGGHTND